MISISESIDGSINLEHLELALQEWSRFDFQVIGCFSAASNVTGMCLLGLNRLITFFDWWISLFAI